MTESTDKSIQFNFIQHNSFSFTLLSEMHFSKHSCTSSKISHFTFFSMIFLYSALPCPLLFSSPLIHLCVVTIYHPWCFMSILLQCTALLFAIVKVEHFTFLMSNHHSGHFPAPSTSFQHFSFFHFFSSIHSPVSTSLFIAPSMYLFVYFTVLVLFLTIQKSLKGDEIRNIRI